MSAVSSIALCTTSFSRSSIGISSKRSTPWFAAGTGRHLHWLFWQRNRRHSYDAARAFGKAHD
eukprot:1115409-Lingulodinium_polyedra.AAC.1